MNSGSEKKLSMDELLEKNRPTQMVQTTPQPPAQELTPPPEVYPSKAEWEELLSSLYTLGYHTERQTGYRQTAELYPLLAGLRREPQNLCPNKDTPFANRAGGEIPGRDRSLWIPPGKAGALQ